MLRSLRDSFAEPVLRRFAKARQLRDAARLACLQKLLNRTDLKRFVECLDLFRAQAGNRK